MCVGGMAGNDPGVSVIMVIHKGKTWSQTVILPLQSRNSAYV